MLATIAQRACYKCRRIMAFIMPFVVLRGVLRAILLTRYNSIEENWAYKKSIIALFT